MGFAGHIGSAQRLTVLEVAVQRRAGTPCGLGDLVHAHRTGIVAGEQLFGGVEDAVGGHLGATLREPIVGRHLRRDPERDR